ncbi:LysR family transcriptional regulator [Aliamphritea spongicola]|nr:LysR family transcriptional regulator [Aliamphritea spongicola]
MTYEQLLVLHAIVSEGTFRGAAERLHKSQSAVSHMLKKLEDDIGFLLLSREAYRPKLTAKGEVFYRQATRALEQMQQLRTTARNLNAKHEASVSLAVTATYPLTPVLNVISQVKNNIRQQTSIFPGNHGRPTGAVTGTTGGYHHRDDGRGAGRSGRSHSVCQHHHYAGRAS